MTEIKGLGDKDYHSQYLLNVTGNFFEMSSSFSYVPQDFVPDLISCYGWIEILPKTYHPFCQVVEVEAEVTVSVCAGLVNRVGGFVTQVNTMCVVFASN